MTFASLWTSLRSSDRAQLILVSTTLTSFFSGFLLGIYSIRGYLISPELRKERAANYADPVESEESDVDEDDTILDHAPNWSNGEEADRKQGLRQMKPPKQVQEKVVQEAKEVKKDAVRENEVAEKEMGNPLEECKLVLVVRTDLGMTKGMCFLLLSNTMIQQPDKLERQNSSPMRPRDPSMLQVPRVRDAEETQRPGGQAAEEVGATRAGQNCCANQKPGRDARADGQGAESGRHGGSHCRCWPDADRPR